MTLAHERLHDESNLKLVGLLDAGDPKGEVRNAWQAKEVVRSACAIDDPDRAVEVVTQLGIDLQDDACLPEFSPAVNAPQRFQCSGHVELGGVRLNFTERPRCRPHT